jgi:phosphomannomutase
MGTTFSAYDIRGKLGENISKEYAWLVGQAFAEWLPDAGCIVVATSVQANESITHAFIEGVLLQGRDVVYVGEGGEQAVVGGIADNKAAGGALISHDGIQDIEVIGIYDAHSTSITAENGLNSISELVEAGNFLPSATKGSQINK